MTAEPPVPTGCDPGARAPGTAPRVVLVAAVALIDVDGRVLLAPPAARQGDGGVVGISPAARCTRARRPRPR